MSCYGKVSCFYILLSCSYSFLFDQEINGQFRIVSELWTSLRIDLLNHVSLLIAYGLTWRALVEVAFFFRAIIVDSV